MLLLPTYAYYNYQSIHEPEEYHYCPRCATPLVLQAVGGLDRPTCPACGFIRFHNPAPVVALLIVEDGNVLLGRRVGEPGRGLWATPSGYIEYGEDFISAGIREAREETGLEVKLRAVLDVVSSFISPRFHFLSVYLWFEPSSGELCASDDMAEVGWFSLNQPLPDLAFQEDRDMLKKLAGIINQE